MAGEKPPPDVILVGPRGAAHDRQSGMGERVALAALRQEDGGALILLEVLGVGREPRHQEQRRAVVIGRDRDERSEGKAAGTFERRERAGPDGPQELLRDADRVEAGSGARGVFHQEAPLCFAGPERWRAASKSLN